MDTNLTHFNNYYITIDIDLIYNIVSTGSNTTAMSATMTKLTVSGAIMN